MTLDDLIALNEEIAALVRAGVPLEVGLAELGGDLPGRLGQFASILAQRTARGESLAQAITDDAGGLPPAYRAVVEAGVRAGRLPAALEAVAASARRLAETYRITAIAAIYPLLLILVAWCGLLFFTCSLAPRLASMFLAFHVPGQQFFVVLARAGGSAWRWGPIVPVLVLLLMAASWLGSAGVALGGTALRLGAVDGPNAPLLAHGDVPRTARPVGRKPGAAAGGGGFGGACVGRSGDVALARQVAAALQTGRTQPAKGAAAFPPLIRWLLLAAGRDGALLPALRHAAAAYHRRARQQSDLLRLFLPIFMTIAVGGSVTALYALGLFLPYSVMLRALAK